MTDALAAAVVKNPIFQKAATDQMFSALPKFDAGDEQYHNATNNVIVGIDDAELRQMKKWHYVIRVAMLTMATLMMVTAYVNFANSSNSIATNFLALYVLFFSILMCSYELACMRQVAIIMVQNFGFMYNPVGRSIFLAFVAIMLFQLSTMGKIMFGFLLFIGIVQIGVNCRHPKFEQYMRITHYYMKEPVAQPTGPMTV